MNGLVAGSRRLGYDRYYISPHAISNMYGIVPVNWIKKMYHSGRTIVGSSLKPHSSRMSMAC